MAGNFSGRTAKFQIGKETTWGTAVAPTVELDFTKEDLKDIKDLKEEDALLGRKFTGRVDIMGAKVAGSFSMIVKPDNIGLLLGCTLGAEASAALQSQVAEVTEVTCPADSGNDLASLYFYISSPSIDYYCYGSVDPSIAGRTGIDLGITTDMTSTEVAAQVATTVNAVAAFSATSNGAVATITAATAGTCTDATDEGSFGATFEVTTQGYGGAASAASSYSHVFTALDGGVNSSLPKFTAVIDRQVDVHGYHGLKVDSMSLEASLNDYLRATFTCIGKNETDDAMESLTASTLKPFTFVNGLVRFNSYLYATVTSFKLTYTNNLENDRYVMDGTTEMIEIEPQGRECMLELDVLYDADTESLRDSYYKAGSTVNAEIYFETDEEIETGYYYNLKIAVPLGYIMEDPAPNIQGPDRITMKLNIKATEGASTEAVTITLGDDSSSDYIN